MCLRVRNFEYILLVIFFEFVIWLIWLSLKWCEYVLLLVQPTVTFETEIFSLSNYMEGGVIFPFICSHAIEARSRPFNRINKRWNCIVPHHKCEKIRNDIALKLIWQQSTCHQFKCTWQTNKQTSHVSTESTKRMKERITCGAVQRKGSNGRKRERELLRSCKNVSPLYTSPSLSMFSKCSSLFL